MTLLSFFLLLSLLRLTLSQLCDTDFNCSLGGKCLNGTNGTYCKCDPTWTTNDCSVLNLLSSKTSRAFYRSDESSWGGSVLYDNSTGLYHMFVSDMAFKCGLSAWETNSRVVHAISTTPEGPYNDTGFLSNFPDKQSVASNIWSHNPTAHYIPSEKLYIVYHIGDERRHNGNPYFNCTNGTTPNEYFDYINEESVISTPSPVYEYPNTVYAQSLHNGHWQSLRTYAWAYNNPAAYFYPNGSVLLISKIACPNITNEFCREFVVNYGESYKGPFRYIRNIGVYGEDPYIWRDTSNNFHLLFQGGNYDPSVPYYIGHWHTAWSYDGINNWTVGNSSEAFNNTIKLQNGTVLTFKKRERTQLLFDSNGYPSHMFNGVTLSSNNDFAYTAVQPINTQVTN